MHALRARARRGSERALQRCKGMREPLLRMCLKTKLRILARVRRRQVRGGRRNIRTDG